MKKTEINNETLKATRGTGTLLYGEFSPEFFSLLLEKKPHKVFVLEGRPYLNSGKVTCKELLKVGIEPTIIADNMAGFLFLQQQIKEVWLAYLSMDHRGALCQVGASILGLLAKEHNVPVFCYPTGMTSKKNKEILSLGKAKDLTTFEDKRIAPKGTKAYVPLVEWVPGHNYGVKDGTE